MRVRSQFFFGIQGCQIQGRILEYNSLFPVFVFECLWAFYKHHNGELEQTFCFGTRIWERRPVTLIRICWKNSAKTCRRSYTRIYVNITRFQAITLQELTLTRFVRENEVLRKTILIRIATYLFPPAGHCWFPRHISIEKFQKHKILIFNFFEIYFY